MEMEKLQDEISTWAESTFDHNERGIALHLLREAVELCDVLDIALEDMLLSVLTALTKSTRKTVSEETADVTILALSMAGHCGFSLNNAVIAKHVVNKVRKWGNPDAQGITEHVREEK